MENNVIMLRPEQRKELEGFVRSGVHSAKLITRARVILALDREGKKDHLRISRISEEVGVARQNIYAIRKDFLAAASVEAFLKRKKRETPPVEAKITGEVEARVIALACTQPPVGCARWTVRLLANRSVELCFVDSLSHTAVAQLLKKRNISLT